MRKIICLLFYFIPVSVTAQSNEFKQFPLTGKISKYEIVKIIGDSLNEKEIPIESVSFSKEGFELEATYYNTHSNHIARREKSTVSGNTITTYECQCTDLTNFIKTFIIRDKAELKNQRGGAIADPPTEYCTLKTIDKKGNIVTAKRYSEHGYQVSEIKSTYDASNNLLTKVVYDFYDSISYTKKNIFDKKGNLTQRISKRKDEPIERKEQLEYDTQNKLKEQWSFKNEVLNSDIAYSANKTANKTTLHKLDKLKGTSYLAEEIIYDEKNREIKKTTFFSNAELQKIIETEYYQNGRIKTKLIYNAQKELTRKILFADDKNNNWSQWTTYQLTTTVVKDEKTTDWKTTTYKLKLDYYR